MVGSIGRSVSGSNFKRAGRRRCSSSGSGGCGSSRTTCSPKSATCSVVRTSAQAASTACRAFLSSKTKDGLSSSNVPLSNPLAPRAASCPIGGRGHFTAGNERMAFARLYASSSRSALASLRSAVSKPSVNQPKPARGGRKPSAAPLARPKGVRGRGRRGAPRIASRALARAIDRSKHVARPHLLHDKKGP